MRHDHLLLTVSILFCVSPALAQETAPGDACTVAETNFIKQVGGPETGGIFQLMRCTGTSWESHLSINADGAVEAKSHFLAQGGSASTPSLMVSDTQKMGIYGQGHSILFARNGTNYARIDTLGNSATFGQANTASNTLTVNYTNPRLFLKRNNLSTERAEILLGHKNLLYSESIGTWGRMNFGIAVNNINNSNQATAADTAFFIDNATKYIGVGTVSPKATLDVNGFARLSVNSSEPLTCAVSVAGSIALTSAYRMCICDGTSWTELNSATACTW